MNSRPLTFVGDDIDVTCPLTPSHFLTGRPAGVQVNVLPDETSHSKPGIWRYTRAREELLNRFWTIWSTGYVRQLDKAKGKIAVGSVILIRAPGCSRQQWPLAVVNKLFPGRD